MYTIELVADLLEILIERALDIIFFACNQPTLLSHLPQPTHYFVPTLLTVHDASVKAVNRLNLNINPSNKQVKWRDLRRGADGADRMSWAA